VAHEAWFADHLFYAPGEDYQYRFSAEHSGPMSAWRAGACGSIRPGSRGDPGAGHQVKSGWLGRFLDPASSCRR
jgi:hypothetical protein